MILGAIFDQASILRRPRKRFVGEGEQGNFPTHPRGFSFLSAFSVLGTDEFILASGRDANLNDEWANVAY